MESEMNEDTKRALEIARGASPAAESEDAVLETPSPETESGQEVLPAVWQAFASEVSSTIASSLKALGQVGVESVNRYAVQMGNDLAEALSIGRYDLAKEIGEQGRVLAERARIRLSREQAVVLSTVVRGLVKVAVAVATATLAP